MTTFQLILALVAQYGWGVNHMDVVTALLNPRIDRDNIYMEMPLGIYWLTSSRSVSSGRAWNRSLLSECGSSRSTLKGSVSNRSTLNGSMLNGSVLILRLALYGLKQASRLWYKDIDKYLQSIGFRQLAEDPNLYLQQGVLLVLYVDDLLIVHNSAEG